MKSQTIIDMMAYPVDPNMARRVSQMSDERLVEAHFVNIIPTAIAGKDSIFWKFAAAMIQEMERRGLKAEGKLQ